MKRIFSLALFNLALVLTFLCIPQEAHASGAGYSTQQTASCGLNDVFTSLACGYIPALKPACPGGATDMNAGGFPFNITVAGDYKLTANAGADATVDQITFSSFIAGQVTICLGGFTLTGGIGYTGRSATGLTIESGIVNCAIPANACVHLSPNTGTWTGALTLDSLNVTNTGVGSGVQSPGAISMDTGSMGTVSGMPNPGIIVRNVKATMGSNPTATRIVSINLLGNTTARDIGVQLRNLYLVAPANANAANGIQVYNYTNIDAVGIYCDLSANTGMSTNARGVAFDGQDNGGNNVTGRLQNLICNDNTGRGFRCRGCGRVLVENFYLKNIQNTVEGALHLCDNDNLKGQASGPIVIQNGTLDIGVGAGLFARGCDNAFLRNLTFNCVTCTAGIVGIIGPLANDETDTVVKFENNTVGATIGSARTACASGTQTNSCNHSGSHVAACSSGTFSGLGTITTPPCP